MKLKMLMTGLMLAGAISLMKVCADEAAAKPAEAAPAAEVAARTEAQEVTALAEWTNYIKQGGTTMIFIGLLSVLGIGCALERFAHMRRSRIVPDGFSAEVIELWKAGKTGDVARLCADNSSMLARVVETMLQHKDSKDYAEVKMFAEDKVGRELRLENRKAAMLSTAATLAPLLGLFGTVFGLLGAFQTVAQLGEMGNAAVLADDIGKALITTVGGLAVSMPCLFVFGLIKNKLNLYAVLLEEEVADLVNQLFVRK
ncbi:MAG: MotA/TolQ/ExbB proton channel family protein [Kiritimatiellia bacterium]